MLRQCLEHSYFRGEICPTCEDKGRFLMNTEELDRLGRIMAGVLRHFPERFDLDMDDKGFVDISQLVDSVKRRRSQFHWLRAHHVTAVVETDPKGRYQIKEELLRATYGHSIDVELDFPVDDVPDSLFYPSSQEELDILLETGLLPSDRKSVHLSHTFKDAMVAGIHRVKEPIILEIDAKNCMDDGIMIQHAGTTVYITKEVPPKYLKVLDPRPEEEEEATDLEAASEANPEVFNKEDEEETQAEPEEETPTEEPAEEPAEPAEAEPAEEPAEPAEAEPAEEPAEPDAEEPPAEDPTPEE